MRTPVPTVKHAQRNIPTTWTYLVLRLMIPIVMIMRACLAP